MLSFPAAIKVYLCTVPCDMRRSFDGLSMMGEHIVQCNPYSGHLLVFCNRRSDRLKILYWHRDGWAIWYKQLLSNPTLSATLFQQKILMHRGLTCSPDKRADAPLPEKAFRFGAFKRQIIPRQEMLSAEALQY